MNAVSNKAAPIKTAPKTAPPNPVPVDATLRRRADRLLLDAARTHAVWTLLAAASTLAGSVLVVLLPAALARPVDPVTGDPGASPNAALLGFAALLAAYPP